MVFQFQLLQLLQSLGHWFSSTWKQTNCLCCKSAHMRLLSQSNQRICRHLRSTQVSGKIKCESPSGDNKPTNSSLDLRAQKMLSDLFRLEELLKNCKVRRLHPLGTMNVCTKS